MDPSGAIHTMALLEGTRVQRHSFARLINRAVFLNHFNPHNPMTRNSPEVMSVRA